MKLISLTLRNFKGIVQFAISPNGENLVVAGDNAAGKTTLFDGFLWCLFGKDSAGKSDFNVKPLNADGTEKHNLETSVEAVFVTDDGRNWSAKRTLVENWVKRRGSASAEFEGNTTKYEIRGVPVQKKDFDAEVAKVCPEDRFRLLTSPTYFVSDLPWQKRREMLIDLCGDVTDEDVIASDPALAELPALLAGNSIDDHKKILAARRPKVADELKIIPSRIDEARRSIPTDLPAIIDLAPLRQALSEAQEERSRVIAGGEAARLRRDRLTLESELKSIENAAVDAALADFRKAVEVTDEAKRALSEANYAYEDATRKIERLQREVDEATQKKSRLLTEYKAEESKTFTWGGEESCAACGQALPPEKVAAARAKAEGNFNEARAKRLEDIMAGGKLQRKRIEDLTEEIEAERAKLAGLAEKVEELNARVAELQASCKRPDDVDLATIPEYAAKRAEIEAVDERIAEAETGGSEALQAASAKIKAAEDAITAAIESNGRAAAKEKAEARVDELVSDQLRLASELEEIERGLVMIEKFIRAKVALLTDRINSRFDIVRWQLFEDQINGGLKEVCQATVNGVPYPDLNHGMKINAGIDVINAFADAGGFAPPVFVDNAESITAIKESRGQQIRLLVSADHPRLTVVGAPTPAKKSA